MEHLKTFFKGDKFAEHSDIELLSVSPGCAQAKMILQPYHCNGLGTVHGGAIFTLADFVFAVACNSHGTIAVAINANITFLKAATTGTLWAEGKENSRNFKLGSYTIEVKDDHGDLVALFQGMAYRKAGQLPA